jgi:hypothetical protein
LLAALALSLSLMLLVAGGAIQNFHLHDQVVTTLGGTAQTIPGGPVASQEAIKLLTAQFVPARCAVWVGVGGQAWALQPNVAEVY